MSPLSPVVRRFIEDAGNASQSFGAGRVIGQIYAYLYFSDGPRSLGDLQDSLGISKGSASMSVRQLEQLGAVRRVWVRGDRKDYYEANDWFGKILKNLLTDAVGSKLTAVGEALALAEQEVNGGRTDGEAVFLRERLAHLRSFQEKAAKVWANPVLKRLLK